MSKKSSERIEAVKRGLCDLWGRILIKPMLTKEVYQELGYDYSNVNDQEKIYRYNRQLQKEAEIVFDSMIEEDKEKRYKQWLDYCYLNKMPYILFDAGFAVSPDTYAEWQTILERICIRELFGLETSLKRMLNKDMEIRGIPLKKLLPSYTKILDLIPDEDE